MSRQQHIGEAFVSLADTFDADMDPLVLVDRLVGHCVRLTGATAAGFMMVTNRGRLRTMAVSDERVDLLEIFQLQTGEGPCVDCLGGGEQVTAADLAADDVRWPRFAALALSAGFHGAYGVPARVHGRTVGAVNLLTAGLDALGADDLALVQALAEVAVIAMVQWTGDPARPQDILTRVQATVSAKATLETAKGMLAAHGGLTPAQAALALRAYGRRHAEPPSQTARSLVHRTLDPGAVLSAPVL